MWPLKHIHTLFDTHIHTHTHTHTHTHALNHGRNREAKFGESQRKQ